MSSTKLRVKLKAYEHRTLDKACAKIVDTVKRTGGEVDQCHFQQKFKSTQS